MEFKAGMYARSRGGKIFGPLSPDSHHAYPLREDAHNELWTTTGKYNEKGVESEYDLIEQVFVSSTPFDETKLDALFSDVMGVITEARVSFPAGREAGPSIEYDEDSIRAILRQAGQITYPANHPKDLVARTADGTLKKLHYKIEDILVKDAKELDVETTVMVLDVISAPRKPKPEAEGLGTVAESTPVEMAAEPTEQPPAPSLDLRLTAKLWHTYLENRAFNTEWSDVTVSIVADLLALYQIATRT